MRALRSLLLVLLPSCSLFLTGPDYPPPAPDEVLDRAFTPQELAADVDELFAIVEEVHPDPYTIVPREEIARRRAALVAGLDRPLTRREFQPRVAELVAALGDGHTSVSIPQQEWWRGPAKACFPIDVEWDGAVLRVRRTAVVTDGGHLAPGARLISIAGRPADELFRRFETQHSGETEAWRAGGVEQAFPLHLWMEGIEPPYAVSFESVAEAGGIMGLEVPGLGWNAVARGPAPASGPRWRLARRDDGVALMAIDTLSGDLGDFEDFCEQSFADLAAAPPAALVIDLRRDSGGDSRLGDELLQYVAHRPWRQAARKDWKMSDRYRDWLKTMLAPWLRWLPVQYLVPTGWRMWTTDAGQMLTIAEDMEEPRDEPLRYDGPVGFLIGPGTFSSAASLAAAVKDHGLALLIGEPTGGVVNGFGEVYPFQLSRTRLGGQVSSARYVRPSGDATALGGVEPDLRVHAEPGAPGDPVLEAAVARLLSPVAAR